MRFSWTGAAIVCGLIAAAVLPGGCGRLGDVGQEPELSDIGRTGDAGPELDADRRAMLGYANPAISSGSDTDGSLWRSGPASLFGDRRARGTGDIVTIVIEIDDQAEISNSSDRSLAGSEEMAVPSLFGLPQVVNQALPEGASLDQAASLTSNSSFSGDGSVQRNEKITLRIAATVVEVLPNGHLVVQGNQEVRVNFELRDLQVAGIVRPEDISRKNEITYDKIAGARIAYGGRGQISDFQQPRYGQQIADIVLPF